MAQGMGGEEQMDTRRELARWFGECFIGNGYKPSTRQQCRELAAVMASDGEGDKAARAADAWADREGLE